MEWRSLLVVPLLVAAACGGGGASASSSDRPHAPRIPTAVAVSLATRADAVAADLSAGDGCGARQEASRLRSEVDDAVAADRIPARLQAPLQSAVASLSSRIVCIPPKPAPKPKPKPEPHHEHHHHTKHEKHGEGD